jgi:flagellar hook-associated protein 3 FlgL
MMRITSNTLASRLTDDLTRLSNTQTRLTQELASGRRLFDASDDVPATGRVMSYESEKRSLQQYERNAQRGLTNINVSTSSLESIQKIAGQIFNIAPAAAESGDPSQNAAFASQIDGLLEQAVSMANTQVSGTYLFGSKVNDTAPFTVDRDVTTGRITAVHYSIAAGAADPAPQIAISESAQVATTTGGTENQQLESFFNNLVALRDAVASDNEANITTYQNTLGDDEDRLTTMLSTLAVSKLRITTTQEQNSTRFNQLADLSAGETEINTADTAVKYKAALSSYEAALQAGSQMFQKSLLDYI